VRGSLHTKVVEELRGFKSLPLGIEPNTELLEDILVGANQHELRTFAIEEVGRIDRDEPAAVEFARAEAAADLPVEPVFPAHSRLIVAWVPDFEAAGTLRCS
jgi:hypothetical protein